jgi:hypothetical protein
VQTTATGVQARLHVGPDEKYLYVVNPDRKAREIAVAVTGAFSAGEDIWGGKAVAVKGRVVTVTVGDRDAAVIRLK